MRQFGYGLLAGMLLATGASAQGWEFADRIAVTGPPSAGVFQHLDVAGRRSIAAGADGVAVVWEDNRSGPPAVYAAVLPDGSDAFAAARRLDKAGEAYSPAVAALGAGRFVAVWEADGAVRAGIFDATGLLIAGRLSEARATQPSVAAADGRVVAVWSEQRGAARAVRVAELADSGTGALVVVARTWLETQPPAANQLYPSVALSGAGVVVAFEDRRHGHTRLYSAFAGSALRFGAPRELNQYFSDRNQYDRGSGVTRVALAGAGPSRVVAAWMDKQVAGKGYSIHAAVSDNAGRSFSPSVKVQDDYGDATPQFNPGVAGSRTGAYVVAWDDYREETADIWLSWPEGGGYSEDFQVAPASGEGEQSHPAVTLDDAGRLHLVWVERESQDAPTRIWYARGEPR